MKGQLKNLASVALVLALATVACSAGTSQSSEAFPTGTFSAIDNTIGRFVMEIRANGSYLITLVGVAESGGSYTLNQNQIVITGGPCTGPEKETGTYTWNFDGKTLTFNVVKDLCPDRWRTLNLVWMKD